MTRPNRIVYLRVSDSASIRAFTLVELIAVLAIMAILAAISVPVISGTLRSYTLETTGQSVINQLSLARQTAVSDNQPVEVRFYYLPDFNQPSTGTPTIYRALQCFVLGPPPASGTPTRTATTKPFLFPSPIILSTGIAANNTSPLLSTSPATPAATDPTLPVYSANYKYTAFHFKPDGSTDLAAPNNSVTLVLENDALGSNGLPKNFVTLSIDPTIGSVRAYRP